VTQVLTVLGIYGFSDAVAARGQASLDVSAAIASTKRDMATEGMRVGTVLAQPYPTTRSQAG
jgi:hypothetical protein